MRYFDNALRCEKLVQIIPKLVLLGEIPPDTMTKRNINRRACPDREAYADYVGAVSVKRCLAVIAVSVKRSGLKVERNCVGVVNVSR